MHAMRLATSKQAVVVVGKFVVFSVLANYIARNTILFLQFVCEFCTFVQNRGARDIYLLYFFCQASKFRMNQGLGALDLKP